MLPLRTGSLALVLLAGMGTNLAADEKKVEVTEQQFRRAHALLLEDPLADSAGDRARVIIVFAIQSPSVAVMVGEEELKWAAKDDQRSLVLMAAYFGGNAQSQLNSGVKRNDRYSGLLSLFQVYRRLHAKDKEFRVAELDELLKLQKEDKLVGHLIELEKKKPTKLRPEDEEAIRKVLEKKK